MMNNLKKHFIRGLKAIGLWLYKLPSSEQVTLFFFIMSVLFHDRGTLLLALFFLAIAFLCEAINNCALSIAKRKIEVNVIMKDGGFSIASINGDVRIFECREMNKGEKNDG